MEQKLHELMRVYIGKRPLKEKRSTHPWLNAKVIKLVEAKNLAQGTRNEKAAAEACSAGILEAYRE